MELQSFFIAEQVTALYLCCHCVAN